jgi:anti-sigma regulatory factor (Ser/Thr protein kinase)
MAAVDGAGTGAGSALGSAVSVVADRVLPLMRHTGGAPEPSAQKGEFARDRRFHHETLFYSGEDGFLSGTLPFIVGALAADEPVLVAVSKARIELLREALSDDAARVGFTEMCVLGRNPARIIPAWRTFLQQQGLGGRPVRGIGEPIWAGRSDAELSECQRHEALLNIAFDDGQRWRLLCPYDVEALDDRVIAAACESHPFIAEAGASRASDDYTTIWDGWSPFAGTLPAPETRPEELEFTREDLGTVRGAVAAFAEDALFPRDRIDDLVLAVDELATNSVSHGGGRGRLRMWSEGATLQCEVSDRGRFVEPLVGRVQPTPQQGSGRGLWLANQLCDLVQIRSNDAGSLVRLHMRPT